MYMETILVNVVVVVIHSAFDDFVRIFDIFIVISRMDKRKIITLTVLPNNV